LVAVLLLSLSLVVAVVANVAADDWTGLNLFWPRPKINVKRNARKAARVPNSVINIGYIQKAALNR